MHPRIIHSRSAPLVNALSPHENLSCLRAHASAEPRDECVCAYWPGVGRVLAGLWPLTSSGPLTILKVRAIADVAVSVPVVHLRAAGAARRVAEEGRRFVSEVNAPSSWSLYRYSQLTDAELKRAVEFLSDHLERARGSAVLESLYREEIYALRAQLVDRMLRRTFDASPPATTQQRSTLRYIAKLRRMDRNEIASIVGEISRGREKRFKRLSAMEASLLIIQLGRNL